MSLIPAVGQPALVELPGDLLSTQRAAVSHVSGNEWELLLESWATVPPLMQLTGASVVVSLGADKTSAHVLRLQGRKLTLKINRDVVVTERRRYFRWPLMQKVFLRVEQAWEPSLIGQIDDAMGDDLSGNGIRVTTALPLRVGDSVTVDLPFDEGTVLSLEGIVRRQLPEENLRHTVGIQFHALSRPQEEKLVSYLLRRQSELSTH